MKDNRYELVQSILTRQVKGTASRTNVELEKLINSILAVGPAYIFFIEFPSLRITGLSDSFTDIHGAPRESIQHINDFFDLIASEDMDFVAKAEQYYTTFDHLRSDNIVHYKTSYNFRMRVHGGQYKLFNHQALVLSIDENGQFCQSLNIHTRIDHLTEKNNYKLSLISLKDSPSFLDIEVMPERNTTIKGNAEGNVFSPRETEIIQLLQQGEDSKSIAEKLFLSTETVKTHRRNILRKSGCKSTPELIAKLTSSGLI